MRSDDDRSSQARRPRRPRPLFAGILLLAVVGGGGWWIGARAQRPATAAGAGGELEALRERLRSLEQEQGRQRALSLAQLARAPGASRAPAEGESGEGAAASAAPAEPAARPPRPTAKEQFLALESSFRDDPIDATWAQPTEAQIKNVVSRFAGTELLSSSCRSRMCRVEVKFANRAARETFEVENVQQPPFANTHTWIQRFPGEGEDPGSRSVLIVSRQGALPSI